MVTSPAMTTSCSGRADAQAPPSTLPRIATTGATAASAARTCEPPTSPACRIRSTPRRALSASGRTRPWVSEIRPRCISGQLTAANGPGQRRLASRDVDVAAGDPERDRHPPLERRHERRYERAVERVDFERLHPVDTRPAQVAKPLRGILVR